MEMSNCNGMKVNMDIIQEVRFNNLQVKEIVVKLKNIFLATCLFFKGSTIRTAFSQNQYLAELTDN